MNDLALTVLNSAIQAGYLVLALLLVRLIFKKAPRKLLCGLWALVGLRLAVPVSLSSVFSLLPARTPVAASGDIGGVYVQTGLPPVDHTANTILQTAAAPGAPTREIAEQTAVNWGSVLAVVWLCGAALLLVYALVSFLRLRLQVREAVREPDGVWLCDNVDSPFILGVVRPRIYLPTDVAASDRPLILAHERAHLKRRDHLWKPLGFLLLAVYWFNPLLWVAYVLLCRDIELACDERVLAQQGSDVKKDYANALLRCSAPKHLIRACPVAFGETGVKSRIKSVLNYKKPAFWVVVLALAASAAVAVCFMTTPRDLRDKLPDGMDDAIHEALLKDNEEGNWSGECATEGHVVYGCEQKGGAWKVYLYHGFERYGFINGYFTDVAGHWMPAVLTMEQIDDLPRYICKQIEYPRDGSENASSIKRLFPKKLEPRALNPTQSDSDEVMRQCEAQAKAYLDSIGREAAVVPYQQLHLQLPNLTAEVSNKLTNELGRMEGLYELTLGTREQLENGVRYVYRTSYLEAQNELLFTKEYYDTQEVEESYLADARTGEWLTYWNPLYSRVGRSPFFDVTVKGIRGASVLVTMTADSGTLKKGTQVELLEGTAWDGTPLCDGAAYRITYRDGSLMETYPLQLQLRDILNIEPLEAVKLYLDGKVTAIEGDWATVSPFRTDTQLPLYGDLVRVATKPEVKGSPIKLEVGKSYRIVFLLKDISGNNPAVINPAQTFYAYDDISSGGNVALVTPTGPGVDPATITTTKQEPTTQQRTTATPPTTKKSEPTTRTSEPFVPPTTTWTTEPAQEGKVTLRILRNMEETSETLVYSLNNGTKETIEFDYYDFQLSRRTATGWETVPRIDMVPDVVLTCNPGRSFRKSVRLGQQFGKQLSAGEYRLQVSYTFHDSGKYETAAARFTVTRIERTTARTPEEMAAINRFGDEVRQRFPHLILSTDTWLFSAYEHMNTYAKFKDAVVSDDSVEPRPGYTPKTVTLVTDKGTYIAQFDKDGNFLSDNQ
ncbi:MAG: M56 family metallopeptidase [Clostridia bacterium]|nr:M56 family metallopeptidase [Clostridia bacterium]